MKRDGKDGQREELMEEMTLGVWCVRTAKETSADLRACWRKITSMTPTIQRFFTDVVYLGPGLVSLAFLARPWSSVNGVLLLHLSSRILSMIEIGLKEGRPDNFLTCQIDLHQRGLTCVDLCGDFRTAEIFNITSIVLSFIVHTPISGMIKNDGLRSILEIPITQLGLDHILSILDTVLPDRDHQYHVKTLSKL
ncbi:hypothetical protein DFH07DRAFT_776621 [Mycena maculata]|uniref:Uncharacterized protein n=1 Tax=Mycena maculata TaxID=230809 RepID=A0AAD7N532_9AGAR|nr:hypothetical protein DFH07DRAFT_776621 [Mycena maculata]